MQFNLAKILGLRRQGRVSNEMAPDQGLPMHETPSTIEGSESRDGGDGVRESSLPPELEVPSVKGDRQGFASFQANDKMYLACPRATEVGMYCIQTEADRLFRHYTRVLEAAEGNPDGLEEMEMQLTDCFLRLGTVAEKIVALQALPSPNMNLLGTLIEYAKRGFNFGEGKGLFLNQDPEDWARLITISDLDYWIKLRPETSTGKLLMVPFERTKKDEGADLRDYDDAIFRRLFPAAVIFLIVVFCAVPMVILALDIMSPGNQVITSLAWVFLFSLLVPRLFPDTPTALFLGVAYTGLLGTLMNNKNG